MHLRDCKCALLVNRACFYMDFTLQVGEPLMGSTNKLSAIHLLMHEDKGHPYITSAKGWMGSECGHFCWCSVQYLCWHSGWVDQKKSKKCADVIHGWSLSNLSDLLQQMTEVQFLFFCWWFHSITPIATYFIPMNCQMCISH